MFVEIIEDMDLALFVLGEKNRKPSVHYTFFYLYPGKGVKSRIIRAGKLLIGCKLEMLPLSYSPTIFPPSCRNQRSMYRQTPIFRHPFFRKQCFSLKYSLVSPPQKFGGVSKFGIYVKMKSSLQFLQCKGLKKATFRRCQSYLHFAKLQHTEGFTNVKAFIQLCLTSTLFC